MGEWIKCSERMPEEGEDVIVTDGRVVEVMWVDEIGLWYATSPYSVACGDWITHWMPLPAPPEQ